METLSFVSIHNTPIKRYYYTTKYPMLFLVVK
jgi:hypothetical protein